ncbi:MAG: hypothetical protein E6713_09500 [Sporomusaceae bacterium]|nr:hypothetical protein [Sporomusaceae bacterium]
MKKWIDQASLWIFDRSLSISFMILLATILWIGANVFYQDMSSIDLRQLGRDGKELGKVSLLFAFGAFAYYGLREFYIYGRKKIPLVAKYQANFQFAVTVLRRLHIWFGVLAITLAIDHGYLLWSIWNVRHPGLDSLQRGAGSGFLALAFLGCLAISGLLIRRYATKRSWRTGHRFGALLFFAGYLVHQARFF